MHLNIIPSSHLSMDILHTKLNSLTIGSMLGEEHTLRYVDRAVQQTSIRKAAL